MDWWRGWGQGDAVATLHTFFQAWASTAGSTSPGQVIAHTLMFYQHGTQKTQWLESGQASDSRAPVQLWYRSANSRHHDLLFITRKCQKSQQNWLIQPEFNQSNLATRCMRNLGETWPLQVHTYPPWLKGKYQLPFLYASTQNPTFLSHFWGQMLCKALCCFMRMIQRTVWFLTSDKGQINQILCKQ